MDDLCGSGVIDSPSVSVGVPRGYLWRVSETATDLPRTCAVNLRDLQDLDVFKNQAGSFLFHEGLEIFTLLHGEAHLSVIKSFSQMGSHPSAPLGKLCRSAFS